MSGELTLNGLSTRQGPAYKWFVTLTVVLGTISTVLTATIVNVALPDIMQALQMTPDRVQLLSTGFLAAMTGSMLLTAWFVDSYGQRLTYVLVISVFVIASIVGGFAPNSTVLILARIGQGIAAGLMQPLSMLVIFKVFPVEKRGSAMGIYGVGIVLAPALGPTLGGFLVDLFSWRYVFFVSIPFSLTGLLMAFRFLPNQTENKERLAFDWLGLFAIAAFLVTLLSAFTLGSAHGWISVTVISCAVAAVMSLLFFIWWENKCSAPLFNLSVFANVTFSNAALVGFMLGAGMYGSTFLIPLYVQSVLSYSATSAGLLLMPSGLIMGIIFPIAGRLADRSPAVITISLGLLAFALSSFLMTKAELDTSFWALAFWIVLGRIGLALVTPSLNVGSMRVLPPALLSQGSGAINFVRQLGGAFGVNLIAVYLHIRMLVHAGKMDEEFNPQLVQIPKNHSELLAYHDAFSVMAIVFALALIPAIWMHWSSRRTSRS
ncbi:MDR family MFS transporter [Reinekea blandensis]|uniref:Permease of the major facilitator superfamily protein n=1 Tax=Reinekea blandensis MED297 TaxID=314283 RepID=A4BDT3_9GAMM|nr:MDR family MFS transporter [Reinekea blandensis]EAR09692.1 Permease of the major facilitator superfamily protein [Reinekea blandensis MED297]